MYVYPKYLQHFSFFFVLSLYSYFLLTHTWHCAPNFSAEKNEFDRWNDLLYKLLDADVMPAQWNLAINNNERQTWWSKEKSSNKTTKKNCAHGKSSSKFLDCEIWAWGAANNSIYSIHHEHRTAFQSFTHFACVHVALL